MLPKSQRLSRGFSVIFQKGAKISTPFFVLRAVAAWDNAPRFAVTVSKKVSKKAVVRNRIRRRLFAAARKAGFPEHPKKRCRIICIGNASAYDASFSEIVAHMKSVFLRLEQHSFSLKKEGKQNRY